MGRFYLKKRDTRPVLQVTLKDPDDTVHDLSGATGAKLHITLEDGTSISKTMVIDADPTTGIVRYTWLSTDWDTGGLVSGTHRMEYEVLGPSAARLSFPNTEDHELVIVDDLGQGS